MKQPVDYKQYLASREWRVRRKRFIEEATYGVCQRCAERPIENVHHLTYANIGNEKWSDLMGLCRPCHEYIAGVRDDDPAIEVIQRWIAKHGLRLAETWPGRTSGSWPWSPLESSDRERGRDPTTLRMILLPESQYRNFAPIFSLHLPRMTVGPEVLAIFDWL